jgi:sarcosine oxidase, subunit beta
MAAIERRAPALLDVGIAHRWVGMYEVTPDHNALLGESAAVSRLLYATGFSGHGFLQGPAVGEVVRDLFLGVEPFLDVSPFSVERFEHGLLRGEVNIV